MSQAGIYFCQTCNSTTEHPKQKGNGWIELVLWLCYLVPGLIYSIWRRSGPPTVCHKCNKETLIPGDSPNTQSTLSQDTRAHPDRSRECPYCAETIKDKAILCRFCGRDVEPCEDSTDEINQKVKESFSGKETEKKPWSKEEEQNFNIKFFGATILILIIIGVLAN